MKPPPNKRFKLPAHVGVFDLSPVRCRLSANRYPTLRLARVQRPGLDGGT